MFSFGHLAVGDGRLIRATIASGRSAPAVRQQLGGRRVMDSRLSRFVSRTHRSGAPNRPSAMFASPLNPKMAIERTVLNRTPMVGSSSHFADAHPMRTTTPAEPVLLAVARGDRAGVRRCIEKYAPLIWSMARRMSMSSADAEDAVQEIFLDLWRYASRFDPTVGSEKVFVSVLARRRLIERVRHMQRRLAVEQPLEEGYLSQLASSSLAENDVEIAEARRILAQLPIPHQEAISLSLVEGLSHGEIAIRLGWPLGTVKTVIRRGILRLKDLIRDPRSHLTKARER